MTVQNQLRKSNTTWCKIEGNWCTVQKITQLFIYETKASTVHSVHSKKIYIGQNTAFEEKCTYLENETF